MEADLVNYSYLAFFVSVLAAYFIGAIPSAFIVGKAAGNLDMRAKVHNMGMGASSVNKNIGILPAMLVAVMDGAKAISALLLARFLGGNKFVVLVAAMAVVIGHNWSIFLNFRGGRGGACIYGILLYLLPMEFIITFLICIFPYILYHKDFTLKGLSRNDVLMGLMLLITFVAALLNGDPLPIALTPVMVAIPMYAKTKY